ncbi:NAD(P)H-dependent oxidoreductase [Paenibacillus physcomitrellae]|uniref:General stress protein 14 n=1 Tax=Paenibacillus physcomitrellae TaxID=1619311 RepID=A0ABQ1FU21_9BACL|nr:NAD(P)H-dependent oxidoreductase [Paenibacillus physcomitrellae]GGA29020.1 general stress protein 14 [Paenibacillus physcomitrellae]
MTTNVITNETKKTLVIVVHPNLLESRINKRLTEELLKRENATIHQLYEVYPDEQIDAEKERQLLEQYDRIVFQFPFYWYSAPYLLKKWLDSVWVGGWAYGPGGNKLEGKELRLAISTGGVRDAYQAGGFHQYSYSELLKPFQAAANRVKMSYMPPFVISGVRNVTDEQLEKLADEYAAFVTEP